MDWKYKVMVTRIRILEEVIIRIKITGEIYLITSKIIVNWNFSVSSF